MSAEQRVSFVNELRAERIVPERFKWFRLAREARLGVRREDKAAAKPDPKDDPDWVPSWWEKNEAVRTRSTLAAAQKMSGGG